MRIAALNDLNIFKVAIFLKDKIGTELENRKLKIKTKKKVLTSGKSANIGL